MILFRKPENYDWYKGLKKPKITPPQPVFPIVWSILYFMIGWSFFDYLKSIQFKVFDVGVYYFIIQVASNLLWPYLFFSKKQILLASIDIILLILFVALTIFKFKQTS